MATPLTESALDVYDITFALPAQSFAVTCWITTEESLPVVTEFALRLTHTCGTLSVPQLQSFFGFNERETTAVVRTLEEEKLVSWDGDNLVLTPYAHSRFLESPDSIPRFFRISEWTGEVVFDLISFQYSRKSARHRHANSMVELAPRDSDKDSKTIYWAERSFQESFRDIIRKDKTEIYKVSEVEAGERLSLPLPCTFSIAIDERLAIERSLKEEVFADKQEIAESISDALSRPSYGDNFALREFVDTFDSGFFSPHMLDGTLDVKRFIEDEYLPGGVSENGAEVMLGSLYLPRNRAKLLEYARQLAAPYEEDGARKFRMAYWVAPGSTLWGRSLSTGRLVEELTRVLRGDVALSSDLATLELRSQAGIKGLLQCDDARAGERLRNSHGRTFSMLYRTTGHFMKRQSEIIVVPDRFACALFHYQIDNAIPIPMGILSIEPKFIERATAALNRLASSPHEVFSLKWKDKNSPMVPLDFFNDRESSVEEADAV